MRVVETPLDELPPVIGSDDPVALRREDDGVEPGALRLEGQQGLPGGPIVHMDHPGRITGHEALVARGRAHRDDGRTMRLEAVDAREPTLAAARRRDDLPRGDAAALVTDDQGAITEEGTQHGHRRAAGRHRFHLSRARAVPHVVVEHLPPRGPDVELLPAAVERQRRHLHAGWQAERLQRLLRPAPADQRLLLGRAQHDELARTDLRHRHRPRVRRGGGEPHERSARLRVERGRCSPGRPRRDAAHAVLPVDVEPHVEPDHAAIGCSDGVPPLADRSHRRHLGAVETGHRDGRRVRPRFERGELERARARDLVRDLPVFVDADRHPWRRACLRAGPRVDAEQRDRGLLEKRIHFRGDDDQDGEDGGDDDDAADHDEAPDPVVEPDPAGRAPRG